MIRHPTNEELETFDRDRVVVMRGALAELAAVNAWVEEVKTWPDTPGRWMRWYETTDAGRMLCRVENLVPYHDGIAALASSPPTTNAVARLFGAPVRLYKDKINLKLPGGAGFGAHQDAPAFATFGARFHVTMMVPLDDQRIDNGCLWCAEPRPRGDVLPQSPGGTIDETVEASLSWRPLEVDAGDVVLFDSYLPHRSPPNTSDRPRRALFLTYNAAADGDHYGAYFAHKRSAFPPEYERVPGVDYSAAEATYNLGNPIR